MPPISMQKSDSDRRSILSSIPESDDDESFVDYHSQKRPNDDSKNVSFCEVNENGERSYTYPRQHSNRVPEQIDFYLARQTTLRGSSKMADERDEGDFNFNTPQEISLLSSPPPKPPGEHRYSGRQLSSMFQTPNSLGSPDTISEKIPSEREYNGGHVELSQGWHSLEFGTPGTQTFRMLFFDEHGKEVSPLHDIPLYSSDGCLNFVCKTPRLSWAEYEPARGEPSTPLRLKNRRGTPAHFSTNAPWNIGMLPKTWADPELKNESYGGLAYKSGPLEVIEVGTKNAWAGDVYSVKALAAFAMVDSSGRLSWMIVAIDAQDHLASMLETASDVEKVLGGTLREIREWLRTCRCLQEGDRKNVFGLNERAVGQLTVARVVAETHASWQLFVDRNPPLNAHELPLVRPAHCGTYESFWSMYHYPDYLSPVQIELSDPSQELVRSTTDCSLASSESSEAEGFWSSESSEELMSGRSHPFQRQEMPPQQPIENQRHQVNQNLYQNSDSPQKQQVDQSYQNSFSPQKQQVDQNYQNSYSPQKQQVDQSYQNSKSPPKQLVDQGYQNSNTSPKQQVDQSYPMRLPEPPYIQHGAQLSSRSHSYLGQQYQHMAPSRLVSQTHPRPSSETPLTQTCYDKDWENEQRLAEAYEIAIQNAHDYGHSTYGGRNTMIPGTPLTPPRTRENVSLGQNWDARKGPRHSAYPAGRMSQWIQEQEGEEQMANQSKSHLERDDLSNLESLRSPRGTVLGGLPPSFDKITTQLDKTEQLHARFNSRLAATKVLLERLRSHTQAEVN